MDFDHTGFEWVDCHNYEDSIISFIRRGKNPDDYVIVCLNFTPVPRHGYKLGVPEACWYEEISNSDSTYFGGSDVGNDGGIQAVDQESHGRPASIEVTLPPLGAVVLKPRR